MPMANGRVWNISAGVDPASNWVQLIEGKKFNQYHLPKDEAAEMMAAATEARRSGFYFNITYTNTVQFRVVPRAGKRMASSINILAAV